VNRLQHVRQKLSRRDLGLVRHDDTDVTRRAQAPYGFARPRIWLEGLERDRGAAAPVSMLERIEHPVAVQEHGAAHRGERVRTGASAGDAPRDWAG
jgi:hypothetical protein